MAGQRAARTALPQAQVRGRRGEAARRGEAGAARPGAARRLPAPGSRVPASEAGVPTFSLRTEHRSFWGAEPAVWGPPQAGGLEGGRGVKDSQEGRRVGAGLSGRGAALEHLLCSPARPLIVSFAWSTSLLFQESCLQHGD